MTRGTQLAAVFAVSGAAMSVTTPAWAQSTKPADPPYEVDRGAYDIPEDEVFDVIYVPRQGLAGWVSAGAVFVNLNGNTFWAPEVSAAIGGRFGNFANYAVVRGATGEHESNLRVTLISLGYTAEFVFARVRMGFGFDTYLWVMERVTKATATTSVGIAGHLGLTVDVVRSRTTDIFIGGGVRGGLFGVDLEQWAATTQLGLRW